MQLWVPPRDELELLAWWDPLLAVARLARADRVPWPIHIDEFDLAGRVDRGGSRLPVWVYRHRRSGGDIYADGTGQTYRYRATPNAAAAGRFERCDVRSSVHLAGLVEVVEPVWYEERPGCASDAQYDEGEDELAVRPAGYGRSGYRPVRSRVPRRRRWLHLVPTVPV